MLNTYHITIIIASYSSRFATTVCGLALVLIPSQPNTAHTLIPYFFKVNFKSFLRSLSVVGVLNGTQQCSGRPELIP